MNVVGPEPYELTDYDSSGVAITLIAEREGCRVSLATFAPGGTIGPHPTGMVQTFFVVAGSGWVAGPDAMRHPVSVGEGVVWERGDVHSSGSGKGMTAVIVQTDVATAPP